MSSLLDALGDLASNPDPVKTVCNVAHALSCMTEDEATAALALIDNPLISATKIAGVLQDHGHRVARDSVRRHRNRGTAIGCRCPK